MHRGAVPGPFARAVEARFATATTAPRMSEATYSSPSKRPRDTFELHQSPPLKRSKSEQNSATAPTETIISYDACPAPAGVDYFYEDLIPKASELSQLFPTLCHDAHVVRRWLGSAGCAIYWSMVMEEIEGSAGDLNSSHHLAGLIARTLAKIRGSRQQASNPKFRTLCEILRSHLRIGDVRIVVFGESR